MMKVWNDFEKKVFDSLYILYGSEEFLIEKTKDLLVQNVLQEDELDFNLTVVDLDESPVETAIEQMDEFPFMGEKRVVILKNAYFLTAAERKRDKIVHDIERLIAYLENPAPFTIAVFIVPYPKLDVRKKVTKLLVKNATVFEAKPMQDRELMSWISNHAKEINVLIDSKAIELLLYMTGGNLQTITSELEKVALHVGAGERITTDIIDRLVVKSLDQNVFALVDKIVHNQRQRAVEMVHDLLVQKEEPIRILAAIARQYRIFAQVKYLCSLGIGAPEIAAKLKISPYPVKLAMQQIGQFSEKELLKKLDQLAEMDFQMKTGYGDKEMLLELFILQG